MAVWCSWWRKLAPSRILRGNLINECDVKKYILLILAGLSSFFVVKYTMIAHGYCIQSNDIRSWHRKTAEEILSALTSQSFQGAKKPLYRVVDPVDLPGDAYPRPTFYAQLMGGAGHLVEEYRPWEEGVLSYPKSYEWYANCYPER
jgi:hypothetical protein